MRDSHKRFRTPHSWQDTPVSQEIDALPYVPHVSKVPAGAVIHGVPRAPPAPIVDYLTDAKRAEFRAGAERQAAARAAEAEELECIRRLSCYRTPEGDWVRDPLKTLGLETKSLEPVSPTRWNKQTQSRVKWGSTKRLVP